MHAPCCACAPLTTMPTRRSCLGASRAAGSHLAQRRGLWVLQDTEVAPRYTSVRYSRVLTARQGVRHSPASARQLLAVEEVRLVRVVRHARERLRVGKFTHGSGWLQASPGFAAGCGRGDFVVRCRCHRGEPSQSRRRCGQRRAQSGPVQIWAAAAAYMPRREGEARRKGRDKRGLLQPA